MTDVGVICKYSGCKYDEVVARARAAELERDRYREALQGLARDYGSADELHRSDQYQAAGMVEDAQKALEGAVTDTGSARVAPAPLTAEDVRRIVREELARTARHVASPRGLPGRGSR